MCLTTQTQWRGLHLFAVQKDMGDVLHVQIHPMHSQKVLLFSRLLQGLWLFLRQTKGSFPPQVPGDQLDYRGRVAPLCSGRQRKKFLPLGHLFQYEIQRYWIIKLQERGEFLHLRFLILWPERSALTGLT